MLTLTVFLYGRTGTAGEFHAYEAKALALFRRHGGEVVAAFVPEPLASPDGRERPDEIQILRIPDRERFEAFLRDPARQALAGERDAVIRKTETFVSAVSIAY